MATSKVPSNSKVNSQQPARPSSESGDGSEDFIYAVVQRYVTDLQAGKSASHAR